MTDEHTHIIRTIQAEGTDKMSNDDYIINILLYSDHTRRQECHLASQFGYVSGRGLP